jgi:hypothetical protein
MPQQYPAAPSTAPMSPAAMEAAASAAFAQDNDVPLGWECADPSLQIERWRQEAAGAGEPS